MRGVHEAHITTKTELAALAGITRPTLDAWLSEPDQAPDANPAAPVGDEWNPQHHDRSPRRAQTAGV